MLLAAEAAFARTSEEEEEEDEGRASVRSLWWRLSSHLSHLHTETYGEDTLDMTGQSACQFLFSLPSLSRWQRLPVGAGSGWRPMCNAGRFSVLFPVG